MAPTGPTPPLAPPCRASALRRTASRALPSAPARRRRCGARSPRRASQSCRRARRSLVTWAAPTGRRPRRAWSPRGHAPLAGCRHRLDRRSALASSTALGALRSSTTALSVRRCTLNGWLAQPPSWTAHILHTRLRACGCCISAEGGSGPSRITSATVLNVDANSVTLQWTALPTATRFKLTYTENGVNFILVNPPPGSGTVSCTQGWC